jgi:hypothetical protein
LKNQVRKQGNRQHLKRSTKPLPVFSLFYPTREGAQALFAARFALVLARY